jgi:hypothetical protein
VQQELVGDVRVDVDGGGSCVLRDVCQQFAFDRDHVVPQFPRHETVDRAALGEVLDPVTTLRRDDRSSRDAHDVFAPTFVSSCARSTKTARSRTRSS